MRDQKRCLVVIDDDQVFCDLVRISLTNDQLEVIPAHTGAEGLEFCSRHSVDVVLLDQKLPDGEGRDFCPEILKHNEQTKIIFITAYPSFENAVRGIKVGAHDYLSKPLELGELRLAVDLALRTQDLEKVEQIQNYKRDKDGTETVLIGGQGGLAATAEIVNLAAAADAPVILTGETGTGKTVVAKYIHYQSPRKNSVFLSINCAALPENLIEAELFGHEKGAFTGADTARKGIFELAEGGTLLLDEIGEMPLHLQAKLLSVLEDGQIKRLGGGSVRSVNVRVIAATNKDLESSVRDRTFREDLYFRLAVLRIHVPPLRERRRDIPQLCEHFLGKVPNGRLCRLPESELNHLVNYDWPGNVRELKNIIERAVIFQKNGMIRPSGLLNAIVKERHPTLAAHPPTDQFATLDVVVKNHTLQVLGQLSGNVTQTAKALDVSLSTLKRRIKEYGVNSK
jgi:DNA-binding NtrC family response regulator